MLTQIAFIFCILNHNKIMFTHAFAICHLQPMHSTSNALGFMLPSHVNTQTLFLAFSHYTTTKFQKGVYYSGIKIFNNLPHNIKDLANETKLFRNALKRFLLSNSFIIVKNILIIRDNLVKTGRKLKAYYFY